MDKGYLVVFKTGKDKLIYSIVSVKKDQVELKSDVCATTKIVSQSQIREATDIELLLGRRS